MSLALTHPFRRPDAKVKDSKKRPFREEHSLKKRREESRKIKIKYPNRIPVILEQDRRSTPLPELPVSKYLAPVHYTVGQFQYYIRSKYSLDAAQSLFFFCQNEIPANSKLMSEVYREYKDDDGFLYISYAGENTFGVRWRTGRRVGQCGATLL